MGKKSSPPPAPDYAGAARQTQLSQMSSQHTPYGSQVYSADPSSPSGFRSDITLAPEAQRTLDTQMGLSNEMGGFARTQIPFLQERYSRPMSLGGSEDIYNKAYGAMTSRLNPQWEQAQKSEETKLINQGLRPGMEAYDNAMRVFNQGRNDAYQQAELGAISTMPQTYQLESAAYQQPLNIFNALRTGAQVQNPTFTAQPGANFSGAAQSQGQYDMNAYNQQVAQQNAMMGGLFGLGSAGIGAYGLMKAAPLLAAGSDRRIKQDIERIGTHRDGFGIYRFRYLPEYRETWGDGTHVGVMADEVLPVRPEVVSRHSDGYLLVDYARL